MSTEPTADEAAELEAMALREHLVESNFDEVVAGRQAAKQQGEADPVVFLVDCEDEIGSQIARAWEGNEAVDDAILDARHAVEAEGESDTQQAVDDVAPRTTILVRTFPFADCRNEVPKVFPYLADSFRQPPEGDQFLILVVAAAGAATFTAPLG